MFIHRLRVSDPQPANPAQWPYTIPCVGELAKTGLEFTELQEEAEEIGFAGVMSGPLVRSSYRAGRLYQQAMASRESARV